MTGFCLYFTYASPFRLLVRRSLSFDLPEYKLLLLW